MKTWLALGLVTLLLVGGSAYLYLQQPVEEPLQVVVPQNDPALAVVPLDPVSLKRRQVTLFVADPATGALIRKVGEVEEHELALTIQATLQQLIHPEPGTWNPALPEGTELLNVFISGSGGAYVNLNRHLQDRHPGGITAELTTISALVNTLLFNFKEIRQVQLLVEGTELETLAGHIDCRKPFATML